MKLELDINDFLNNERGLDLLGEILRSKSFNQTKGLAVILLLY